jgi:predicted nucleotidyltransferase
MIKIDDQLISRMAETLVREIQPKSLYLFGSRATGQAHPDSDVDFMVVVDHAFRSGESRMAELLRIRKLLSGFRVPKDIIVYSADEVAHWRSARNHIIARCLREGKLLYERS